MSDPAAVTTKPDTDNLATPATNRAAEIKRQLVLLMFPTTIFILVPCFVVIIGSLLFLATCPSHNAQMTLCQPDTLPSATRLAVYAAVVFATAVTLISMLARQIWAVITNMALIAALVVLVLIWIFAWIYTRVIVSGEMGFSIDFSSVMAALSMGVILLFAGFIIWYPCRLYYRHIILRSIWVIGALSGHQTPPPTADHESP